MAINQVTKKVTQIAPSRSKKSIHESSRVKIDRSTTPSIWTSGLDFGVHHWWPRESILVSYGFTPHFSWIRSEVYCSPIISNNHMTVGTGGSPENWSVWWCTCNKTPLFTVSSAHTQIASMLMLREHMPCLFATRGRFFMTFLDTFSSQHIETA